jgi:hypothetical protein
MALFRSLRICGTGSGFIFCLISVIPLTGKQEAGGVVVDPMERRLLFFQIKQLLSTSN